MATGRKRKLRAGGPGTCGQVHGMHARLIRAGMAHACKENVRAHDGLCRRRLCRRRLCRHGCNRQFASIMAEQVDGYGQIWCRRNASRCICHGSMSKAFPCCRPEIGLVSLLEDHGIFRLGPTLRVEERRKGVWPLFWPGFETLFCSKPNTEK